MFNYAKMQKSNNAETRTNYKIYTNHREHSTSLILSQGQNGRLLIVGAGNCNDVDLVRLSRQFSEIHLLDIDEDALSHGIKQQLGSKKSNITIHVQDVTQFKDTYNTIIEKPYNSTINRGIKALQTLSFPSLPKYKEYFDVVVSQCMLSQLLAQICALRAKEKSKSKVRLIETISREIVIAHLKELIAYLSKGCVGIVITDVVSNEGVGKISDKHMKEILYGCYHDKSSDIYGKNIFGTNIVSIFADHKNNLDSLAQLEIHNPMNAPFWKWDFSETRQYIVQSFVFKKA
jgi:hypothetical protein